MTTPIDGSPYLGPFTIPVLVVCYYPVYGDHIDRRVTGDVGHALQAVRSHVSRTTQQVIQALESGSTYHGYKDRTAQPSLHYQILDVMEIMEPLPLWQKPGLSLPMTDYNAIMQRVDIRYWVLEQGVKEVWLWAYHGDVLVLWESNMSGPYGDVSNSPRDMADLPVLDRTYTVYHYNYGRGPSEAVEDHMHQIEALLRHVDPHLFWNKFVGQPGQGRCGWSHFPPNGVKDYDWANPTQVWTDIEDWRPEGGPRQRMNCTRWKCDSLTWFIYWMQNVPGLHNRLTYRGRPLTNWWSFIGDFDLAMERGLGLVDAR